MSQMPDKIIVRGAKVHNLKNIDIDIPLHKIVAIAGVSGSGKSSLALGVLYAEGSRRYLDSLSTYTRRRMTSAAKAQVDELSYIPAALALRQRPGLGNIRSTFGTGTELLNSLRLMFSRLASHVCPNGHRVSPTLAIAAGKEIVCPVCHTSFYAPSAEELSFNSQGACTHCGGTGIIRSVDFATLVPDETKTIEEGAVAPWNSLMWSLMVDVCREMGVRTNIPFNKLTDTEKEIVYHGPAVKKHILYKAKNSNQAAEMDFTYYNAVYTVENALAKVKDEKGMKRVEKFLKEEKCPHCHGSRLSEKARMPRINGYALDEVCRFPLDRLTVWVKQVPSTLPKEMRPMAESICSSFLTNAERLLQLGLGYLSLDRSTATLSTGERQRMQLARAVRNRTSGVLYVLDEPSIGLHPSNIIGLTNVMRDLVKDGNSVVLVDHETEVLKQADWMIEMGPKAGADGGSVIAQGTIEEIQNDANSLIAPFLKKRTDILKKVSSALFADGTLTLSMNKIHTVQPLTVNFPKGKLSAVSGVSGSGKTTMILESLVPALEAAFTGKKAPSHVLQLEAAGIQKVKLIDASPIGINVRSTVATYVNIHDEIRKLFAKTKEAKENGLKASAFSYNTGSLRCVNCDGTGEIRLDVQFLPDVDIPCPVCHGTRYDKKAEEIHYIDMKGNQITLPQLMAMDVNSAIPYFEDVKTVYEKLKVLQYLGLGYLTLGEETPHLSGGEAQRLKLAQEIQRTQTDTLFVFDEPTIGLHPLDVKVLLEVFQSLIQKGATIIVIEHDLDILRHADYIVDMGPGGGNAGGKIVAAGPPDAISKCKESITGTFL